jgi:hypothetical protein
LKLDLQIVSVDEQGTKPTYFGLYQVSWPLKVPLISHSKKMGDWGPFVLKNTLVVVGNNRHGKKLLTAIWASARNFAGCLADFSPHN